MDYPNSITPDGKYAVMYIPVNRCKECSSLMVLREKAPYIFSKHITMTQLAQVKRLGLKFQHNDSILKEDLVCTECFSAGAVTFRCSLCDQIKTTDKIQESVGYLPSEYLCKDCYATTPAIEWENKLEELHESHKYDYL